MKRISGHDHNGAAPANYEQALLDYRESVATEAFRQSALVIEDKGKPFKPFSKKELRNGSRASSSLGRVVASTILGTDYRRHHYKEEIRRNQLQF
jgi:hypothetical protein